MDNLVPSNILYSLFAPLASLGYPRIMHLNVKLPTRPLTATLRLAIDAEAAHILRQILDVVVWDQLPGGDGLDSPYYLLWSALGRAAEDLTLPEDYHRLADEARKIVRANIQQP